MTLGAGVDLVAIAEGHAAKGQPDHVLVFCRRCRGAYVKAKKGTPANAGKGRIYCSDRCAQAVHIGTYRRRHRLMDRGWLEVMGLEDKRRRRA